MSQTDALLSQDVKTAIDAAAVAAEETRLREVFMSRLGPHLEARNIPIGDPTAPGAPGVDLDAKVELTLHKVVRLNCSVVLSGTPATDEEKLDAACTDLVERVDDCSGVTWIWIDRPSLHIMETGAHFCAAVLLHMINEPYTIPWIDEQE